MDNLSFPTVYQSSYQPGGYSGGGSGYAPTGAAGSEPAGAGPRILAYLIDGCIMVGIILVGVIIGSIFAVGGSATGSQGAASAGAGIGILIYIVFYGGAFVFYLYNEIAICVKNNGQTIGKKMMKIRIVKEDGSPMSYGDAFLRNVVGYWISSLVCGLGFIWALFDARKQAWHDKIFKTQVVAA
jgi:uncharacterized RDD family membrane protein YckC